MTKKLTLHHLLIAAIIGFTISSCASISSSHKVEKNPKSTADGGQFNHLVSKDVVSVLVQINELSPAKTTLGTSNDDWQEGDFADALRLELETAGYGIRSTGKGEGTTFIGYSVSDNTRDIPEGWQGQSQTVTVMAGDIAVRRSYLVSPKGVISPLGKMQVKGVDASTLTQQRGIFEAPANSNDGQITKPVVPKPSAVPTERIAQNTKPDMPEPSSVPTERLAQSTPLVDPPTQATAHTTESQAQRPIDERSNQAATELASKPEDKTFLDLVAPTVPVTEPSGQTVLGIKPDRDTKNVMELQQSNFEDLFAETAFVGEKVLTFANDSTQMGAVNKVRLQELIDNFEADSDIFSVVGCSLGQTNHAGGQEGLARGRAMRVREELLYAGIPGDNIVEEGCWADEAFDLRMPRRGVVVTLKRRVG